jgi:hypothetical protein
MDGIYFILAIIYTVISIAVLIRFFGISNDIKDIRDFLINESTIKKQTSASAQILTPKIKSDKRIDVKSEQNGKSIRFDIIFVDEVEIFVFMRISDGKYFFEEEKSDTIVCHYYMSYQECLNAAYNFKTSGISLSAGYIVSR